MCTGLKGRKEIDTRSFKQVVTYLRPVKDGRADFFGIENLFIRCAIYIYWM